MLCCATRKSSSQTKILYVLYLIPWRSLHYAKSFIFLFHKISRNTVRSSLIVNGVVLILVNCLNELLYCSKFTLVKGLRIRILFRSSCRSLDEGECHSQWRSCIAEVCIFSCYFRFVYIYGVVCIGLYIVLLHCKYFLYCYRPCSYIYFVE